ncbi:hypothetical protein [Butyricicoccus sp.]|uniref:hypothetical protein n=1 Tax=Butyricicoccus sp. TaxID=2049021 RepID=UPI003F150602
MRGIVAAAAVGIVAVVAALVKSRKNTLPAYAATQTGFGRLAIEHKYHRVMSLFRQNRCIHNSETKIKQ